MNLKRAKRKEKFRRLGEALSRIGDPSVSDYHTGRPSLFEVKNGDSFDKFLHEMPLGPEFKTPQWERTVKRG